MTALEFKVGDTAWIYVGDHKGKLTKGKVVAILDLPGWCERNYVVEIRTPMDPVLEVRTGHAMSDRKSKPIGLWRGFRGHP